jgi:hypothetical protein
MTDDLRLPEESIKRIEDHLERLEAQLEQRIKGMESQAIRITLVIGVLILFLVYMLFRACGKL